MSFTLNQQYLKFLAELMRLIMADGRLTYDDALYVIKVLLDFDWREEIDEKLL